MKINITKETFERIVLTATQATADVFNSLSDIIDTASAETVISFFPTDTTEADLSDDLLEELRRYICFSAFYTGIPLLDLVLTDTGFGVVSNQNLAPASRERVDALRVLVRNCRDDAADRMLYLLPSLKGWGESVVARFRISSLLYTGRQLREYGGRPDAYRSDLKTLFPAISEAEEIIRSFVGREEIDEILQHIRTNSLTNEETMILSALRRAIGFYIVDKLPAFRKEVDDVVNVLEDNLSIFTAYAGSEAYKVKHFEHYKNDKDDTTYFFG